MLHLLHSRNNVKNTYFPLQLFVSRFPDARDSLKRNLKWCNIFIQGTGVVSIISFDVITLRSMGSSTQVYVYQRKSRVKVSIYVEGY